MKTVCIECRQFHEWDEKVQQRILDKHYDINTDHGWWKYTYDDAKNIGELMGIEIENIYFSGFSSQGDGACFEGYYRYKKGSVKEVKAYAPTDERLHRIAERLHDLQKGHFYGLTANVKQYGHYSHEYCTEIDVSKNGDYLSTEREYEAEKELIDILRDYMRWIYRQLEAEYYFQTSKEAIIETLKANEYEFDQWGKIR